jgi:hypothetical protein
MSIHHFMSIVLSKQIVTTQHAVIPKNINIIQYHSCATFTYILKFETIYKAYRKITLLKVDCSFEIIALKQKKP